MPHMRASMAFGCYPLAVVRPGDSRRPSRSNAADYRILASLIGCHETLSLTGLAARAGVSRRSMTTTASQLAPRRILEKATARFGPGAGLVLAAGVGTENIRAALVDANGVLHCEQEAPPDRAQLSESPEYLLRRLRKLTLSVLGQGLASESLAGTPGKIPLLGAAVAWPGPIQRDGYARGAAFSDPEWQTVPLVQRLSAALGGPFADRSLVDSINGANAAVASIAFDRASLDESRRRRHSEIVMAVRIGGIVGAGTIRIPRWSPDGQHPFLRSQLLVGTNGHAGELGHFPIGESAVKLINAHSPPRLAPLTSRECSCGRRGHLEGLIGAVGLARRLAQSGYPVDVTRALGPQLDPLLQNPDETVGRALHDLGRLLGQALASPILMLDPANITLTGYFARPEIIAGIRGEQALLSSGFSTSVEIDQLTADQNSFVEVRGAALLRFRRLIYRDFGALTDQARWEQLLTIVDRKELEAMHSNEI